jgi:hypothetical protein
VLVGTLTVALLAACGGESGDDGERPEESSGGGNAASAGPPDSGGGSGLAAPETQLAVPSLYDTSRGWQTEGVEGLILPHAQAVAEPVWGASTAEARIRVRDVTTGQTRWTSEPVDAVSPDEALSLLTLSVGGHDYVVMWSVGVTGGDVVEQGDTVTALDVFPVDGSTTVPEPTHVELEGEGRVHVSGGLLVSFGGDEGFFPGEETHVAVDPVSGEQTPLALEELEPPASCGDCDPPDSSSDTEIIGMTANGPLLGEHGLFEDFDSVWVSGDWSLADIAPDVADPADSTGSLVTDGTIVAVWPARNDDTQNVWAAVDSTTGEVRATLECPASHTASDPMEGLSSNGRYLFHEQVVFDLQEGTGHCFAETEDTNPVHFTAVSDTGYAFGLAGVADDGAGGEAPVQLDIATGDVAEISAAEASPVLPVSDIDGYGIFVDDPEYPTTTVIYASAN